MENNTTNTVNQSLLNYQITQNQLETARDLLSKAHAEIDILRKQAKENKIVSFEQQGYDSRSGKYKTTQKLELNIEDPTVSTTLMDMIGKVKNQELLDTIKEKEDEVLSLNSTITSYENQLNDERKQNSRRVRDIEENKTEALRKQQKKYEEAILELEIENETISKSLADLKKDKTQAHIELARQEEIDQLEEKAQALENFKNTVEELKDSPIKLRKFLYGVKVAADTNKEYPWINKLWSKISSAVSRVEAFERVLNWVGSTPKRKSLLSQPEVIYRDRWHDAEPCECGCCCDNDW